MLLPSSTVWMLDFQGLTLKKSTIKKRGLHDKTVTLLEAEQALLMLAQLVMGVQKLCEIGLAVKF